MRNDSDLSDEAALAALEGGVKLEYGGVVMLVMPEALAEARKDVAQLSRRERRPFKASVERALKKSLTAMKGDSFSKETADNFFGDLLLWEALKPLDS